MNDIKFCKDCKHLKQKYDSTPNINPRYCMRPNGFNLVTGEPQQRKIEAELERILDLTGCGNQAKYFEPKRNTNNIESEF